MPAVKPKSHVLVTGVTGFIAAWTAEYLLEEGYFVYGTVRDQAKAKELEERFSKYADHFEIVTVKDVREKGAFDQIASKVDGILHIASPFHFNTKDSQKELIEPAVEGTLNVLRAAAQSKTCRRVVITSSYAAMMQKNPAPYTYTENDWNKSSSEEVKQDNTNAVAGYLASKSEAEQAAWDFVKEKKPSFDISVINPVYVFGPFIHPVKDAESINTSVGIVFETLKGGEIKEDGPQQFFVDVRDVARAHVRALQNEKAGGNRHITSGGSWRHGQVAGILKKNFPDLKIQTPKSTEVTDDGYQTKSITADDINIDYIPLEQSIIDTAKALQKKFL